MRTLLLTLSLTLLGAVARPAPAQARTPVSMVLFDAIVTPLFAQPARWFQDARAALLATPDPVRPTHVTVTLYDVGKQIYQDFTLPVDGAPDEATLAALSQFLHCHKTRKVKQFHPGLAMLIADVGERWPGKVIEIYSAYRGTRDERRTSPHRHARAVDFRLRGVKSPEVRDWLWATHTEVGVGWYPYSNFIHMDVRPGQKDTSWTQRSKTGREEYRPGWAYKARKAAAKRAGEQEALTDAVAGAEPAHGTTSAPLTAVR